MKKALICGISGQDGVYLAQLLVGKGYAVFGTSRMQNLRFDNLTRLGLRDRVQIESMDLRDLRSVSEVLLKILPDEVYHLAGQSSVGLSFESPVETIESVTIGTLNLLEAIRSSARPIKFFNAGSSECFGDTGGIPAN
ncbi:MAG TPA: GDP-mannose 4,6-dehydratase, partial [Nitrospirota bacterium]